MANLAMGVLAALLSPLMMTFGFIIWDQVWRGTALGLNLFKCSLASILFIVTICIFYPPHFSILCSRASLMLVLSSFLGIVIGDNAWLLALQRIGARRVIIVDAVKPFISALLAMYFLPSEHMSFQAYLGMAITIIGVLIVSLEKERSSSDDTSGDVELKVVSSNQDTESSAASIEAPKDLSVGYVLALVNVLFDAYGAVLTKQYGAEFTPWEINLVRFGFASIALSLSVVSIQTYKYIISRVSQNKLNSTLSAVEYSPVVMVKNSDSEIDLESPMSTIVAPCIPASMTGIDWMKIAIGVTFVTYLCPTLANYALFQMDVGICLTLTSLGPLYSLPLVYIMKNEKSSIRTLLATAMSIFGVAILFIRV